MSDSDESLSSDELSRHRISFSGSEEDESRPEREPEKRASPVVARVGALRRGGELSATGSPSGDGERAAFSRINTGASLVSYNNDEGATSSDEDYDGLRLANPAHFLRPLNHSDAILLPDPNEAIDQFESPTQPMDLETADEGASGDHPSKSAETASENREVPYYGDIDFPPSPTRPCPKRLETKVAEAWEKMQRHEMHFNQMVQQRKDFRNPSIYEKLIQHCQIDELGSNLPPNVYDPHSWSSDSFYEELSKGTQKEMERREKERKEKGPKVEYITATNTSKGGAPSDQPPDDKKKTKWDVQAQPVTIPERRGPIVPPPTIPVSQTLKPYVIRR